MFQQPRLVAAVLHGVISGDLLVSGFGFFPCRLPYWRPSLSPLGGLVARPGTQSCHLNTSFAFLLNWIPYSWMSGLLALSLVLSQLVHRQRHVVDTSVS